MNKINKNLQSFKFWKDCTVKHTCTCKHTLHTVYNSFEHIFFFYCVYTNKTKRQKVDLSKKKKKNI